MKQCQFILFQTFFSLFLSRVKKDGAILPTIQVCGIQVVFIIKIHKENQQKFQSDMKGKQIWSQEEDSKLKCLVFQQNTVSNWSALAQKMNVEFPHKKRSAKQCRERYINYVSMDENARSGNDWTPEETESLFYLFEIWGSRWTKISQEIKGKSENCVKNRFYGSLRKALRKLNRAARNLVKKFKKEVKYESITRIIDAAQGLFRLQSPLREQSQVLSKKILSLAKNNDEQMPCQQAEQLIIEINKFNMCTRSYKSKKKIKNQPCPCPPSLKPKKPTTASNKESPLAIHLESHQESSTNQQNLQQIPNIDFSSLHDIKMCNEDGLINYEEEGMLGEEGRDDPRLQIEGLLEEILSPLECGAWM